MTPPPKIVAQPPSAVIDEMASMAISSIFLSRNLSAHSRNTSDTPMPRHAFLMKLKPGNEAEYKKRHDAIWPELARELKAAGISDYSIFLDPTTGTLFAVQKLTDDNTAEALPQSPVVKKWWAYMKDLMETHADNAPFSGPLVEVFHLD